MQPHSKFVSVRFMNTLNEHDIVTQQELYDEFRFSAPLVARLGAPDWIVQNPYNSRAAPLLLWHCGRVNWFLLFNYEDWEAHRNRQFRRVERVYKAESRKRKANNACIDALYRQADTLAEQARQRVEVVTRRMRLVCQRSL